MGGDGCHFFVASLFFRFQSTPPRGRRQPQDGFRSDRLTVSIHASAWEANHQRQSLHGHQTSFNPRLRVGGDRREIEQMQGNSTFQSTPPRGRRRMPVAQIINTRRFQSTPPRGRRPPLIPPPGHPRQVSIHASAWEASSHWRSDSRIFPVSIHASAWEATTSSTHAPRTCGVSIHASAWEATGTAEDFGDFVDMFQSTPPRGRRPNAGENAVLQYGFQSTPPRGRRHSSA